MRIHFVCTSNTFRSRLAETYFKSKKIPGIKASSSGVEAKDSLLGPITWYAQRIIHKNGLASSESPMWTQTTQKILNNQDIVIFMQKWHYNQSVKNFGFKGKNFEIWDIEDVGNPDSDTDLSIIFETEEIYRRIKSKVDDLVF